jgi:hypothetical protein
LKIERVLLVGVCDHILFISIVFILVEKRKNTEKVFVYFNYFIFVVVVVVVVFVTVGQFYNLNDLK